MASWKKTASILLIVMIILVTGCVKKNNIESPATESATNEVEVSVSTQKVSSKSTPSLAPTPTETPTETTDLAPSATQAVVTSNPTLVPSVNPTQTVAPTAKPTVKPTIAPKTTAPTVKPTAKPTATVKPTPTPTAKPTLIPYDDAKAQYWVDFATEYAASIGLRVKDAEEYANNLIKDGIAEFTYGEGWETASWQAIVRESSSWDTPIVVCAKMNQSYIPEDLTGRLDDYKRVGIKGVCIWYEKYDSEFAPTADSYEIYIAHF